MLEETNSRNRNVEGKIKRRKNSKRMLKTIMTVEIGRKRSVHTKDYFKV